MAISKEAKKRLESVLAAFENRDAIVAEIIAALDSAPTQADAVAPLNNNAASVSDATDLQAAFDKIDELIAKLKASGAIA